MSCLEVIEHLSYKDRQFQYLKGTCRKDGGGGLRWGMGTGMALIEKGTWI